MKSFTFFACLSIIAAVFFGCDGLKQTASRVFDDASDSIRDENATPEVVEEQQRKERIRQDRTWTAENQAAHPIEYCQAQLEKLTKHDTTLEATILKLNVASSAAKRKISESETSLSKITAFMKTAKQAYREAEAKKQWPMTLNGFQLTQEEAQKKIVQANRQIPVLQQTITSQKNNLNLLEKKKLKVYAEQEKAVALRAKIQATINDLNVKKITTGTDSLADTLNALNDSIESLNGKAANEPSLDDLMTPSPEASTQSEFDAIMKE